jgi:hypothetical protein
MLRLIEHKCGPPSEAVCARIASPDSATLRSWSECIPIAGSLDAVLP